MKKLFTIVLLMSLSIAAFAQNEVGKIKVTPMVGLTSATTTLSHADRRVGMIMGAEAQKQLNPVLALSGGLFYAQQGCSADVSGVDYKYRNNYLNIPVLLNVYVTRGLALKAGLQADVLLSAKLRTYTMGESTGFSTNYKDLLNTAGLSVPVGVSYEFSHVVVDARYNWGLTHVEKDVDGPVKDYSKNSVFQLTLGYRF